MNRFLIFSAPILIFVVLLSTAAITATDDAKGSEVLPFKGLTTHFIERPEACGPQPARQVTFDPKISKLVNTKSQEDESAPEVIRVIETKIDNKTNTKYFIDYSNGMSCDPGFSIVPSSQKESIGDIGADHIIIPGNGFIYSIARSDEEFTVRRKYAIRDGKIVQVPQPVLSVGLESKAVRDLKIHSKKNGGEVVATIPKGSKVTVLINDGEHYLLKTPFGLVGWTKFETGSQEAKDVEGIFFMGD